MLKCADCYSQTPLPGPGNGGSQASGLAPGPIWLGVSSVGAAMCWEPLAGGCLSWQIFAAQEGPGQLPQDVQTLPSAQQRRAGTATGAIAPGCLSLETSCLLSAAHQFPGQAGLLRAPVPAQSPPAGPLPRGRQSPAHSQLTYVPTPAGVGQLTAPGVWVGQEGKTLLGDGGGDSGMGCTIQGEGRRRGDPG